MGVPRTGGGFRQVAVSADLAKEVVDLIQAHPELGFRTLSEFVRHAAIEQMRHIHVQLALKALWATTELGADAVEAVIRDGLPAEYRRILESERRRHGDGR